MPPEILLMLAKLIADKRRNSAAREAALAPQAGTAEKVTGAAAGATPQIGGAYLGSKLAGSGSASVATPNIVGASRIVPSPSSVATPNLLSASRVVPPEAGFGNLGLENLGYGNFGSMGIGPQAGIVAGTALTAKGVKDLIDGKKSDPLTRGVTAMSTFGFSEGARALGFGDHKSTKEIQSDKWSDMVKEGKLTKEQADHFYFKGAEKDDQIYDEGPRKGQKWSWEGALEDAKKDPKHFAAVAGNIDTLGQDFWKLSDQQRDTWVKTLIDNDQYYSSKGMINIKDQDFARQAHQDVLSGKIPLLAATVDPNAPATDKSGSKKPSGGSSRRGGGRRLNLTNPFLNTPDPDIISEIIKTNVTSTPQFGHDVQSVYNDNEYFNPLEYRGIYG